MQNRYKSSWSQAPAGEPPSLPSPYLPMYTRPRWLRHPCRVGEYPCGGYRQVRVGQTSWYASVRRQLEKQRHVSMVLVQHGSKGEKHREEERGSENQGPWGTGGEKERRNKARPSGTQHSIRRRPPSAPPCPSTSRLVPRRWRGAPCARLAACARVSRRCRRACVAGPGRGVPE